LPWLSFRGRETIEAGRSFHVTARACLGPLLVTTRDWYEQGVATAQVRLFGLIPVMSRHGPDLARSARGRLVVESTWLPSSFLPEFGAHWSEEGSLLQLTMSIDNEDVRVTMRVESDGLLRELSLQRWSDLTDPQEAGSMLSPSAAPFSSLSNIRRYMHAISRFL